MFLQKKRLSITHSFGSEHSDSSDGLLGGHSESPPRTPGPLGAHDKDRSSTPISSGSDERQFIVKVSCSKPTNFLALLLDLNRKYIQSCFIYIAFTLEIGANSHSPIGQNQRQGIRQHNFRCQSGYVT